MGLATLEAPRTETLEPPPEFQLDSGRVFTTHPESDERQSEQLSTQARAQVRLLRPRKERNHAVDTSLEPLQEWEGVVEWLEGDTFGARLTDLTSPGEDEFTEFALDEVVLKRRVVERQLAKQRRVTHATIRVLTAQYTLQVAVYSA